MTRKVYIGNVDNDVDNCMDRIKRTSEDRITFEILSVQDLLEHQLTFSSDNEHLPLFVPYLNQYQGVALFVNSTFVPQFDVDMFFNFRVMSKIEEPVLYFVKHDAWLFDCNNPILKNLNPVYINSTDISTIKRDLQIVSIDTI